MSDDIAKADQIAYRFYAKLLLVVNNARTTAGPRTQPRADKWFNLETPDSELFRERIRIYRSISLLPATPAFELQVLLSVPELTNNQVLVYLAPDSSRVRVEPTPRHILLESWFLTFYPTTASTSSDDHDLAPSVLYKHGIALFRSIFTLLRLLPAWRLFRRLRRHTGGGSRIGNFSIRLHVRAANEGAEGILGFDTPPSVNRPPLAKDSQDFPSLPHPMGTLSLSVTYLLSPNFQLDELESLLSSRFLSLEEGADFTPTLVKNQQRDSLSTSPGSLPVRTSLPVSPPSSVAERFILPAVHTRTTSLPGPTGRNTQPFSRPPSNIGTAGSASGISVASSSRHGSASGGSKDEGNPMSALAARMRRESTTGRGADLPSSPALPIRRPSIVHPFKSSTLSSSPSLHSPSPSLRQHSPLSGATLPSRPAHTSPTSSRVPPLPVASSSRTPASPVGPLRPSPTFAPSSLGDRRSLASAESSAVGEAPSKPTGKRYSSSFGHRYALSGAGSDGSAGSGERREGERAAASYLSTNTDDDDLSGFVQDIDARKPLTGRHFLYGGQDLEGQGHDRDTTTVQGRRLETDRQEDRSEAVGPQTRSDAAAEDTGSHAPAAPGNAGSSPILTSQGAVDERLRQMNEAFLASLEGLGGRRRPRARSQPDASSEGSARSGRGDRDNPRYAGQGRGAIDIAGGNGESRHRADEADEGEGGYGRGLLPARPRYGSGFSIASAEVIGKLELDDDQRRSRGQE